MSLGQNKKSIELGLTLLIGAALALIAGGLLIAFTKSMASEVEKQQQEILCRKFNEMRFAVKEQNPLNFPIGPNVCRTIHKEVPSDDYEQTTDGAKQEIRDMMVDCWWMWLDGTQVDMLNKGALSKQPCFVCYTFTIKKDKSIESFGVKGLEKSLIQAFEAKDTSDNCNPTGGGFCYNKKCTNPLYPKQVSSEKCEKEEVCCVSKEPKDECINKGGNCLPDCSGDFSIQYGGWSCASYSSKCCIKSGTYYSYLDYFQADGNGKVLFPENFEFRPQENIYAITFLSPGRECRLACWSGFVGSIAAGIATGVFISPVGGAVVAGAGMTLSLIKLGDITDINYLLVSEFSGIEDKCAAEFGED